MGRNSRVYHEHGGVRRNSAPIIRAISMTRDVLEAQNPCPYPSQSFLFLEVLVEKTSEDVCVCAEDGRRIWPLDRDTERDRFRYPFGSDIRRRPLDMTPEATHDSSGRGPWPQGP